MIGANGIDELGITVAGNPAKKLVTEILYTTIYQPTYRISSLRYNASTMAIVLSVLLEGAMFGIWYLSTSSNMLISQCVALCAIAFFLQICKKKAIAHNATHCEISIFEDVLKYHIPNIAPSNNTDRTIAIVEALYLKLLILYVG